MQVLGTPITLWNPQSPVDLLGGSILEGMSIPPIPPVVNTCLVEAPLLNRTVIFRFSLLPHPVFHPPIV